MRNRTLLLTFVFIWAAAVLIFDGSARHDPGERTSEFLMDMAHSPAYESQGANPVFPDGRNLRPPPPGSIARGFMPFAYAATDADAKRAGSELINPFAGDVRHAARGAEVYGAFCAVCHGAGGKGDGPVTTRGVPPPPSLLLPNALAMKDGEMYHVITLGRNNMPAHAAQVAREDRWKAILRVRELQESVR